MGHYWTSMALPFGAQAPVALARPIRSGSLLVLYWNQFPSRWTDMSQLHPLIRPNECSDPASRAHSLLINPGIWLTNVTNNWTRGWAIIYRSPSRGHLGPRISKRNNIWWSQYQTRAVVSNSAMDDIRNELHLGNWNEIPAKNESFLRQGYTLRKAKSATHSREKKLTAPQSASSSFQEECCLCHNKLSSWETFKILK